MAKLSLYFTRAPEGFKLVKTIFVHPSLKEEKTANLGAYGFFWKRGVQALVIFLLRWAAWDHRFRDKASGKKPVFEGKRPSPAASLNDVLTRKPGWVEEMFGSVGGEPLLNSLISRWNADFNTAPGEPVRLDLEPKGLGLDELLSPFEIEVFVSGKLEPVENARELDALAVNVEEQWKHTSATRKGSALSQERRLDETDVEGQLDGNGRLSTGPSERNASPVLVAGTTNVVSASVKECDNDGAAATYPPKVSRYQLTLKANREDVEAVIEVLLSRLRESSGDYNLQVEKVEDGSVKLTLSGTQEGYEALRDLVDSGELSEVLGFDVEQLEWLGDEGIHAQESAVTGPGRIHLETVLELVKPLRDGNPDVRRQAVEALSRAGPVAREALPELVKLLKDEDSAVRRSATSALEQVSEEFGPAARSVVPELAKLLRDEIPHVRERAAEVLKRTSWPESVPELVKLLDDRDPNIRDCGAEVLGLIGKRFGANARGVPQELLRLLRDEEPSVRGRAAAALAELVPDSRTAVPELVRLLDDEEPTVRADAVGALARIVERIGPAAQRVVPELAKLLSDSAPWVRNRTAEALTRIGWPIVVPVLARLLMNEDSHVRERAAEALTRIGWLIVVPELAKLLNDNVRDVVERAVQALLRIDWREVVELLDNEDPDVRAGAAKVLGFIGPAARGAVPDLVRLLRDEVPHVRASGADALGSIGPAARVAVPELVRLLKDDIPHVRQSAAEAIERIRPPGQRDRERTFQPV